MPTTYTKLGTEANLSLAAAWSPAGGPPSLAAEDLVIWNSSSLGGTLSGNFGAKGITFNGATANITYNGTNIGLGSSGLTVSTANNRQFLFNLGTLTMSAPQTWSLYHTTSGTASLRITTANGLVGNFPVQVVNSSPSISSLIAILELDRCSGWASEMTLRERTRLIVRGTSSSVTALPLATIIMDGTTAPQLSGPSTGQAYLGGSSGALRILRSATLGGGAVLNIYSPISVEGAAAVTLTVPSIVQCVNTPFSGTAPLVKDGVSALRFTYNAPPSYSGPLTVSAGDFQESTYRASFASVQLLGGASNFLNISQTADYTTPPLSGAGTVSFDGAFSGNGVTIDPTSTLASISVRAQTATLANRNNTKLVLSNPSSAPASIWLRALSLATSPAMACRVTIEGSASTYASNIIVDSSSNSQLAPISAGQYTLAASGSGPVTITGNVSRSNTANNATAIMTLRLGGTNTADNRITGTVSQLGGANNATLGLTKVEAGHWTLAGAMSHTGPTTVEQGSLRLEAMNHDNTNTGVITVNSGAVLQLVTNEANPRRVTGTAPVTVNGTLRTGASASASAVAKYGGAVTFNSGAVLELGAA